MILLSLPPSSAWTLLFLATWAITNSPGFCYAFHQKILPTLSFSSLSRYSPIHTKTILHNDGNSNNNQKLDKGFNLLEIASSVVPQGKIVSGVKESWKFAWKRMMAELAPQDSKGRYTRPSYGFKGIIGSPQFPDEPGRYHLYVGNPCPVSKECHSFFIDTIGKMFLWSVADWEGCILDAVCCCECWRRPFSLSVAPRSHVTSIESSLFLFVLVVSSCAFGYKCIRIDQSGNRYYTINWWSGQGQSRRMGIFIGTTWSTLWL